MIDKDLIGKVRYPKRDVRILLRHYMRQSSLLDI